jgi:hypothetical protein
VHFLFVLGEGLLELGDCVVEAFFSDHFLESDVVLFDLELAFLGTVPGLVVLEKSVSGMRYVIEGGLAVG